MRLLVIISVVAASFSNAHAQIVEVYTPPPPVAEAPVGPGEEQRLEVAGRGLVDYGLDGQIQASAQVVKIRVGEPAGFSIPLYLLTGTTSGTGGSSALNKSTVFQLISPTGGVVNGSAVGVAPIWHKESGITLFGFTYHVAAKLITGRDSETDDPKVTGAGYVDAGIRLQTGAWTEAGKYEDGGIFWLQLKYVAAFAPSSDLETYFGTGVSDAPHGPSLDLGIYIKNKVNVKFGAFIASGGDDVPTLDDAQIRFAFDYNVRD